MPNHTDLCSAYVKQRNDFRDYQVECEGFVRRLLEEAIKYLQCTPAEVKLTLQEECFESSYFTFKLDVKLYINGPNSYPQQELIFPIWLKKAGNQWIVKLEEDETDHKIGEDFSGVKAFFDYIFGIAKNSMENNLENFLKDIDPQRKIGFGIIEEIKQG